MPDTIHILMTGAGAPGAPGIIRCLLQDPAVRLTVADASDAATGKFLHPDFIRIPSAEDPSFIDTLFAICRERKVDVVLPLVTRELFKWSQAKNSFAAAGIHILVSSEASINIANNKSACYQVLEKNGLPVPAYHVVRTTEEFIHAAYELGHPAKSFCFKPSISNGSRGVRIVADSLNELEMLFHQKPYNLYITYAHALKILSSGHFPELLVSEFLPGEEYSVDCIAKHGDPVVVVPRLRQRMVNGISVSGEFIQDREIISYCSAIIRLLGLHGNIGIQVKRNERGEALLLEINPRVQGTIVAGLGAGINLPLLAVKNELGLPVQPSELEIKWGTRFSRYWTEVFH